MPELAPSQPEALSAEDLNTYAGIAEHYDLLMTSGYYDYQTYADALHAIMNDRRRIMELGVGTGLLVEKLLEHDGGYQLTGIDNTKAMLDQAKERHGDKMAYVLQDVTELSLEQTFEGAFSVGGCWYFIQEDSGLNLYSHIEDKAACFRGLKNVVEHLESGGKLAFALQGIHSDYSRPMPGGLVYEQKIHPQEGGRFTKHYLITKDGVKVGEQFYSYLVVPQDEVNSFFAELGCEALGLDPSGEFFVYKKQFDQ
jgi:SAM-dependent methyltransferase